MRRLSTKEVILQGMMALLCVGCVVAATATSSWVPLVGAGIFGFLAATIPL